MTHTPGPWRVTADPHNVEAPSGQRVARAMPGGAFIPGTNRYREIFEDEQLANARLIAAAPDLLEVVAGFLFEFAGIQWVTPEPKLVKDAKAAFTKATGEALLS